MTKDILNQEIIIYENILYSDWENNLDFSSIPSIIPETNQASIRAKAAKRSNRYFKEVYVLKRKEKNYSGV